MKKESYKPTRAPSPESMEHIGPIGELFSVRLNRLDHMVKRAVAGAWENKDLRQGTIGALSFIAANPGISQNDIVRETGFDKSAVNAIVNSLEELNWAYRTPSGTDRRRHALYATEEGVAAVERVVARIKVVEARMLASLSKAQRERFLRLMDQMHATCIDLLYSKTTKL